ncbi:MAG: hypothetical protein AB1646_08095 [Thermodesulfobacteriota bacterium]
MTRFEDIQRYLPQYLSLAETRELLREIDEQFPAIHPTRMYTAVHAAEEVIFQGDGLSGLLYVHLPNPTCAPFNCMVYSNTCDIDPLNKGMVPPAICYAPIIRLDKLCDALAASRLWKDAQIRDRMEAIRSQKLTTAFYLPRGGSLEAESVVLRDRICHCDSDSISRKEVPGRRLFTLSQLGAYWFFFKLSVHFLRMTDKVVRPMNLNA